MSDNFDIELNTKQEILMKNSPQEKVSEKKASVK